MYRSMDHARWITRQEPGETGKDWPPGLRSMNRKTVFRTLAIVSGILLVIYVFSYFGDDTRGWQSVDTSVALSRSAGPFAQTASRS